MIGSFLTRGLVMVFGYAYPAYECYKTVEMNKPDIEQLLFWCQYWILVAVLTVSERIGDAFVSWVPMYSESKLAFFIYLWYPKTRGTCYVYDSFRPYVAKHENEIDHNLMELRTRVGDMAFLYRQRATSYGQTRIFEILQYIASQSTPRPDCPQYSGVRARQPSGVRSRQSSSKAQSAEPEAEEPPSLTSSTSSTQHEKEVGEEVGTSKVPSQVAKPTTPSTSSNGQKADTVSERSSQPAETETEAMQIESVPPPRNEDTNSTPKETLIEDSIRLTRGRLRKTALQPIEVMVLIPFLFSLLN
ncbi:HVA22-like protein i [Hibiscus syriacus]|uniref:HVA22-like protein n=1 Tax=Hibiscus syriacus TaxID=106335 RepID=A0A6A3BFZ5_HIBSY|nr:HVA22-like protein i [Hibiscus syriacus]